MTLKVRLIPTVLYRSFGLVKSIQFASWRHVGSPVQTVQVYNLRDVDELVFLDIAARDRNESPDFDLIDDLADFCQMPLTVGGGIRGLTDIHRLFEVGADRIVLNSTAFENPSLVESAAARFGSQAIVVSIDARRTRLSHQVFTHGGREATGLDAVAAARQVENSGAGEILLTSIDQDGTFTGFDLDLIASVTAETTIPVVASGGAGTYDHLYQALKAGASAVAAASIFHFTEQTPTGARAFLSDRGIQVRR